MEFFAHPWYMAAGGALISSPILIHLINRMRFKRIRWAAMEFLLKSQKRNRRRLIIEQMILLLLRILLVLLAAFLVARFLYGGVGPRGAAHVVIIDDTLSMHDAVKAGVGGSDTAYQTGIKQVLDIARSAAQAPSAQNMRIFLLSELNGSPLWENRLSDQSVDDIDNKFAARKREATLLHVNPLDGLRKGREFLSQVKSDGTNKVLHFVSDFRDRDWTGPDAEKLKDEIVGILDDGVNLNLIDVATPYRSDKIKVARNNDNLALIDLKADTRVAIEDGEVEFTATLMNYGGAEARTFLKVYVNGENDLTRDMVLEKLAPRSKTDHKFTLRFPRKGKGVEITEKDTVEERERKRRLEREFFHVRVTIQREETGLNLDNVRDMVIEVRKKVPTLVVDGNPPEGRGENGDMFFLQSFYAGSGVYEVEERTLSNLEKADLDLYPSIILLNVAEIPKALIPKLKAYVENGGSLCYFMGEAVLAGHYNDLLFKEGLFPLQIEDRPYDPLAAAGMVDPEARKKERERLRQVVPQPKVLFRDPEKNILAQRLAPVSLLFRYLSLNVYWKATPRSKWDPDSRKTDTPIVLPNASSIDRYRARALELATQAQRMTEKLAGKEAEMKRFVVPLENHARLIRNALASGELFRLSDRLQDLLTNPGVKDDPEKPRMSDLWMHPEMKGLAAEIKEFRDSVLYGDPLVVSKAQGKGRVVAILTPAGTVARRGVGEDQVPWNNWGAGDPVVSATYPLFLLDLHRYLISEGQAPNRTLGEEVRFQVDATRYDPKVSWTFEAQPDMGREGGRIEPEKESSAMEKTSDGKQLTFTLTNANQPGVYKIALTGLGDVAGEQQEVRAYAYNVDAVAESDLKRAAEERLKPDLPPGGAAARGKLQVFSPSNANFDQLKEKQPDASESPWLYLFFIIILVVEQAMAVHLSHHMKAGETAAPGPLGQSKPTPAAA
jgi:hypothetical protein